MTNKPSQVEDILNYSDGIYMTIDSEWVITYINQLAKDIFMIPAQELIGSDFRETLPDAVSIFYKTLNSTLQKKESHTISAIYGPTQKTLELRSIPTENGVLAIFHDITVTENNLKKIRDSEIQQRALFETLFDALITIDEKGLITSYNPAAAEMFGYQDKELIGVNVSILMPKNDRQAHEEYTAYSDLNEKLVLNQNRELYGVRKDDSKFPIEITISPMNVGEHYGYMAILRDITERKEAQNKILHEKNKAERACHAKSKFLSSMSHELHTPLNAIMGYSQLLEMNPKLDTEFKEQVIEIHKAGKHLLNLVEDVLNFTEIDTGNIHIHSQAVSLEELLVECLALISSISEEKNISLTVHPDCYQYLLLGDPVRLRQVFVNIISNAIQYNSVNGTVDIDCEKCNNHQLKIAISDNGSGIEASRLDQIFEPFNRLGREGGPILGTGIGLSITKQLIESMDGNISVESTEGEGCRFIIELPLSDLN